MSIRYNEELDPNEGPSFTEFVVLGTLFALILLLIPVGVFALSWPVWVLGVLMVIDLILLFLLSMTSVFLLRIFFADRRRGRGRIVALRELAGEAELERRDFVYEATEQLRRFLDANRERLREIGPIVLVDDEQ